MIQDIRERYKSDAGKLKNEILKIILEMEIKPGVQKWINTANNALQEREGEKKMFKSQKRNKKHKKDSWESDIY